MDAAHEGGSAGGADGGGAVVAGEGYAFAGEAVEAGGVELEIGLAGVLPGGAEVTVAEIIDDDEDDVRFGLGLEGGGKGGSGEEEGQGEGAPHDERESTWDSICGSQVAKRKTTQAIFWVVCFGGRVDLLTLFA